MRGLIDLTGQTFDYWKVIKRAPGKITYVKSGKQKGKQKRITMWECLCTRCGHIKNINSQSLRKGETGSCCNHAQWIRKSKGVASFNRLFDMYKRGAKRRGHKWKLSKKEFEKLTKQNCYYCNSVPSKILKSKGCNGEYVYSGIDRMDTKKGYIKNNCVSCCEWCNRMKWIKSKDEFIKHVYQINKRWAANELYFDTNDDNIVKMGV